MILIGRFDCYPRYDQRELLAECLGIAESLGDKIQVRPLRSMVHLSGELPVDHPAYIRLLQLRDQHYLYLSTLPSAAFTAEEMSTAELFALYPNNYIKQHPEETGTIFERITCPACKLTYRVQHGPLVLKNARLEGLRWSKPYGDDIFLVSPGLANLISQWNASGVELDEVRSADGGVLQVVQVRPKWILPDLAPSTPFQKGEVCTVCGRFGRAPWQLHYQRRVLGEIQDFGLAPVYFSMNLYAVGKLIISRRIHNPMKRAKVRGYEVRPVKCHQPSFLPPFGSDYLTPDGAVVT